MSKLKKYRVFAAGLTAKRRIEADSIIHAFREWVSMEKLDGESVDGSKDEGSSG